MAAGDVKKPHVDVDPKQYSPGAMRTRAVLPGEILVDGNGNPLGGSIVVISTDADAALAAVESLAADMDTKISQTAQDAFDGAVELMNALEEQDEFDDAAAIQAALDGLQAAVADLEGQIADVYSLGDDLASYTGAVDDVLSRKIDAVIDEARGDTLALVESTTSALEEQIGIAVDDAAAALDSEAKYLDNRIDAVIDEALTECTGAVNSAAVELEAQIADGDTLVMASLVSEFEYLDRKINATAAEARGEADTLVESAQAQLTSDIATSVSAVEAYVDAEVKALNDRIGIKPPSCMTTDATPTVVATIVPPAASAARIYAKIIALRDNHYEAASYNITALARAIPSEETLTLIGNVSNGDQVQIDGQTYTFEAVLTPGGTNNVLIGGSAGASLDNLIKALDNSGVPDTDYGSGTVRHPTFTAARGAGTTLIAIARLPGTSTNGSGVTDPVDVGGVMSWGAAVTSGGTDMSLFSSVVTTEHEDDAAWAAAIAVNGANVEILVTGALGKTIMWQPEVEVVEVLAWV